MKKTNFLRIAICLLLFPSLLPGAEPTWKQVQDILGRPGTINNGIIKIGFPRTDLHVRIGNVAVKPGLALGSWAAFSGSEDSAMMMGDLVLLPGEIEKVMDRLQAGGVQITALHNHLLHEIPHVMYIHYMGHGQAEALAKTLREALATTATPLKPPSLSPKKSTEGAGKLNAAAIEKILGRKGSESGGVLSFGIPRAEVIMDHGMEIPPFMGTANSINFQAAPGGVATTGDFVLISSEVNPVMRALRSAGIHVTALHNHMLDETPRLFFMHFWGEGTPEKVAGGLKNALDLVHLKQ